MSTEECISRISELERQVCLLRRQLSVEVKRRRRIESWLSRRFEDYEVEGDVKDEEGGEGSKDVDKGRSGRQVNDDDDEYEGSYTKGKSISVAADALMDRRRLRSLGHEYHHDNYIVEIYDDVKTHDITDINKDEGKLLTSKRLQMYPPQPLPKRGPVRRRERNTSSLQAADSKAAHTTATFVDNAFNKMNGGLNGEKHLKRKIPHEQDFKSIATGSFVAKKLRCASEAVATAKIKTSRLNQLSLVKHHQPQAQTTHGSTVKRGELVKRSPTTYDPNRPIGLCPYCGKIFQSASKLLLHAQIHTRDAPFKCYKCKFATFFNEDLLRHLNSRHPGSNWPWWTKLINIKISNVENSYALKYESS